VAGVRKEQILGLVRCRCAQSQILGLVNSRCAQEEDFRCIKLQVQSLFPRCPVRVSARLVSCFGETGFVFRRDRFRVSAKPVSCFGGICFVFP